MTGEELKALRKYAGYKQQELADKIGVSLSTVRSWEQGQRNMPDTTALLIKSVIRVDVLHPYSHNKKESNTTNTESNTKTNTETNTTNEAIHNKNGNSFFQLEDGSYDIMVKELPFKAYASYVEHLDAPQVFEDLNTVSFNVDKVGRGHYMAFKIKGDSMNGGKLYDTPDGASVLGRELLNHHWKDGFSQTDYGWIIMSKQNIFHKDIIAIDEEMNITCHSRNPSPEYSDFTISLNDVYRIFKVIKRTF